MNRRPYDWRAEAARVESASLAAARRQREDYCRATDGDSLPCTLWPDHRGDHRDVTDRTWPR